MNGLLSGFFTKLETTLRVFVNETLTLGEIFQFIKYINEVKTPSVFLKKVQISKKERKKLDLFLFYSKPGIF